MNTQTFSFIVRIWIDNSAGEGGPTRWHGQVTHVPGGERLYIKNLHEISAFIATYLPPAGLRLLLIKRFRHWLHI